MRTADLTDAHLAAAHAHDTAASAAHWSTAHRYGCDVSDPADPTHGAYATACDTSLLCVWDDDALADAAHAATELGAIVAHDPHASTSAWRRAAAAHRRAAAAHRTAARLLTTAAHRRAAGTLPR